VLREAEKCGKGDGEGRSFGMLPGQGRGLRKTKAVEHKLEDRNIDCKTSCLGTQRKGSIERETVDDFCEIPMTK